MEKDTDYESLSYHRLFWRALRTALITLMLLGILLPPGFWLWRRSMTGRETLREAKNVLENMELLGMELYGFDEPVADGTRESGLSWQAEALVRSYSGAQGEIHLGAWDAENGRVIHMTYRKERFLVEYNEYEADDAKWKIYWNFDQSDGNA